MVCLLNFLALYLPTNVSNMTLIQQLTIRNFLDDASNQSLLDYQQVWQAMQKFTRERDTNTVDEIWLLEHAPVYTLGKAADESHVLNAGNIPLVRVDRGGQVTYHGPGQIMLYLLANLTRRNLGVRELVERLEQSVIALLASYGIQAKGDRKAPGVYVDNKKIAALGLRISRGCSYHGLCLNVDFDASPFLGINPCGYADLEITQMHNHINDLPNKRIIATQLADELARQLGYSEITGFNSVDEFDKQNLTNRV